MMTQEEINGVSPWKQRDLNADGKLREALRAVIPIILVVLHRRMRSRSQTVAELVITDDRAAALTDALAVIEDYLLEE